MSGASGAIRSGQGRLALCGLLALLATSAAAQATPDSAMRLPRLTGEVRIDGVPGEDAWRHVTPLPLTALYPTFASPLTESTEIRVAYDATHLYASIVARDKEPGRILANTLYRDRWNGDDEFSLILDTFNDRENAAMFLVTPTGVRVDNLISNNAEPGRGSFLNRDWNVPWDARAVMSAEGWTAEFRVPFTSLRYRVVGGETRMRLKAFRYLPRKGENQMFPPTRPTDGPEPHFQPSLGQEVVLFGLPSTRPLFVTPYAAGNGRDGERAARPRIGGDAKLAITSALALDATVNTDFAQVEADDQQINLTRFSLFFPEKRPFFQERSGLFSLATGGNSTLFYSRRVGLDAQGRPRPLDYGARAAGNIAGLEVAALGVRTAPVAGVDDGEWIGVLRSRRALSDGAFVGGVVTSRTTQDATQTSVGVDATFPAGRLGRLSFAAAQSFDSTARSPSVHNTRVFGQLQRNAAGGLSYNAEYRASGALYDPALGFVQARGFHEGIGSLAYTWRNGPASRVREHFASLSTIGRHRTTDSRPDEVGATVVWGFAARTNWYGNVRLATVHEDVPATFALTNRIIVPAGAATAHAGRLVVGTPFDRRVRSELAIESGELFGGRRQSVTVQPTWVPSRHLEFSGLLSRAYLRFPGEVRERQDLIRVRTRVAFSLHWFAESFVQRNTANDATSINVRLRYNPSEGHDLWIAADETRFGLGAPRVRAVVVKYSRMFTIELGG